MADLISTIQLPSGTSYSFTSKYLTVTSTSSSSNFYLLAADSSSTSTSAQAYLNSSIYITPSTGLLAAKNFRSSSPTVYSYSGSTSNFYPCSFDSYGNLVKLSSLTFNQAYAGIYSSNMCSYLPWTDAAISSSNIYRNASSSATSTVSTSRTAAAASPYGAEEVDFIIPGSSTSNTTYVSIRSGTFNTNGSGTKYIRFSSPMYKYISRGEISNGSVVGKNYYYYAPASSVHVILEDGDGMSTQTGQKNQHNIIKILSYKDLGYSYSYSAAAAGFSAYFCNTESGQMNYIAIAVSNTYIAA